jgi:hypothetical protein
VFKARTTELVRESRGRRKEIFKKKQNRVFDTAACKPSSLSVPDYPVLSSSTPRWATRILPRLFA